MADDKFRDSRDESDESTPVDPTGAQLGAHDLPEAEGELAETPSELTDSSEIVDPRDTPDDGYVDDPQTADINEAKLDRATDKLSADGDGSRRRSRARPVRKDQVAEVVDEPAEHTESSGPGRTRTTAPVRKDQSTRAEAEASERKAGRTTPAKFVAESVAELRKVVWPTGTEVQQYFVVVLVFVLFIMTLVSLLDLGFGWVILKVFG